MRRLYLSSLFFGICLLYSPLSMAQFGQVPETEQGVTETIENIKSMDVPDEPGLLFQEMTSARDQLQTYRNFRNQVRFESLDSQKATFKTNLEALALTAKECVQTKSESDAQTIRARIDGIINGGTFGFNTPSGVADLLQGLSNLPPSQLCAKISEPTEISALEKANDQDIDSRRASLTNRIGYATRISDAWRDRYDLLRKKAAHSTEATILRVTLLLIVGGVSVFAWMIFRGVTKFEASVQRELVISGQLIQFPTVMILLVVIVVLGLSGILDDKTLGALLGGIAGYVLAQGVGQSASRQALQAVSSGQAGSGVSTGDTHRLP